MQPFFVSSRNAPLLVGALRDYLNVGPVAAFCGSTDRDLRNRVRIFSHFSPSTKTPRIINQDLAETIKLINHYSKGSQLKKMVF